jgi:hypothetical protein
MLMPIFEEALIVRQMDWYTQPTGWVYLYKGTCFFGNLKVED